MACGDMGSLPDAHGGEFALSGDIGRKDHRISGRARMPDLSRGFDAWRNQCRDWQRLQTR
jgi:hypothetical protein